MNLEIKWTRKDDGANEETKFLYGVKEIKIIKGNKIIFTHKDPEVLPLNKASEKKRKEVNEK